MKRLGVIDLGTNTFHILIVDALHNSFKEVYRKREYVILAEDGIDTIGLKAIDRATQAVDNIKSALEKYQPEKVKVFGTEALRRANNGHIITDYIKKIIGEEPEVIDGKREAELILKGTELIVDMDSGMYCLMDIGGGSVEFIIVNDGKVEFMESYKIGVTVLYNEFHKQDPISSNEIDVLYAFLSKKLTNLKRYLDKHDASISLVGASGSYEVLQTMIEGEIKRNSCSNFTVQQFYELYKKVISTTEMERMSMEGLPTPRTKLIVVALILIKYVLEMSAFTNIIVSPYALKEGAISELLE